MVTWTAGVSVSVAPSYFSGAPTSRACSALSAIAHDFSRLLVDLSLFFCVHPARGRFRRQVYRGEEAWLGSL